MTSSFVVVVLLLSFLALCSAQTLCVPANGGNASSVLGKTSFTNGTAGGFGLNDLANPNHVIVDAATQKVFVTDGVNNRILRYTSTNALLINNGSAELTLFGNTTGVCTNATVKNPDQMDILNDWMFVADFGNFRAIKLTGITTTNTTLTAVTTTFGQINSSNCALAPTQTLKDLYGPNGVAITNNGSLFVGDASNLISQCFVRRFDNATNTTDYPTPNALLGDGTCAVGNSSVSNQLRHLFIDKTNGHLFVADYGFHRVSLFKTAQLRTNATGLIDTFFGQINSTSNNITCDSQNLDGPYGVHFDTAAQVLIVADQNKNRVVFFNSPIQASTGAVIANVLGSNSTTTCPTTSTTQSTFANPQGVYYSIQFPGLFLMVADNSNSRVLRFECTNATFSQSISISNTIAASSPGSSTQQIPSSTQQIPSSTGLVPSSVVVPSSTGVAPSSAGVPSSTGVAPSSAGVPSSSGGVPLVTPSGSGSQSTTPSNTPPLLTESNTPFIPPPVGVSGAVAAAVVCGNGVIERSEECDAGAAVPRTKCCSAFCTNLPAGSVCGKATTRCTKRPKCRKTLASRQLVCTPGQPKAVGTRCGKGGIFSRKTCKADGSCSK